MARMIIFLALSVVIFVGAIGTGWMYREVSKTRKLLVAAEQNRTTNEAVGIAAYVEPAGGSSSGPISELPAEILNKELVRARHTAESASRKFEGAQIKLAEERRQRQAVERDLNGAQAKLLEERTARQAAERALSDVKTELAKQREETETAKLKIKMMTAALALERSTKIKDQPAHQNTPAKPAGQSETRETAEHAIRPAKADIGAAADNNQTAGDPPLRLTPKLTGEAAESEKPAKNPLSLVSIVQTELKRVGCYQGQADGVWNEDSRHALWKFVKYGKHNLSSPIPPKIAIKALKAASGTVCP